MAGPTQQTHRHTRSGVERGKSGEPGSPRLTFFVGKGGVGKTTVSAAFALQRAAARRREKIILVSSDPAHSLADVLSVKLGSAPKRITSNLAVWQIDAKREFEKFLARHRAALIESLAKGTLFTAAELSSFLDATFPGMAEMGALLGLHALLRSRERYRHIVVDTAPFGHTLRLFQIPEQLKKLLDLIELSESRDAVLAQSFGGRAVARESGIVTQLRAVLDGILAAINPENAEVVLVTTAEKFSLHEAKRVSEELQANPVPLRFGRIVLNRAVEVAGKCKHCATRARKTKQAQAFLKKHFPHAECLIGEDSGTPILGPDALLRFGRHVFAGRKLALASRAQKSLRKLMLEAAEWPAMDVALAFTLGKGGVGKTTVSAATAFHARRLHEAEVTVCSTDPAPSLDDIFDADVGRQPRSVLGDPGLRAVETDSVALLKAWMKRLEQRILPFVAGEQNGVHVELSFEHDFLRGVLDLVPPGVDEIFATFEILNLLEARGNKLVIDMAPTGHALELLRTPERLLHWSRLLLKALSGHRHLGMAQEIAVELAGISQQAHRLLEIMNDRKQSQIMVVMLAEPLPDRETQRLLAQLAELKLAPAAILVNRVLDPASQCKRCTRSSASQQATLVRLQRRMKGIPLYMLPEMPDEPVGKRGMERLIESVKQASKKQISRR